MRIQSGISGFIFLILILLLSGCGGGNGDGTSSEGTHFILPSQYRTGAGLSSLGTIAKERTVRFYYVPLDDFNLFLAGQTSFSNNGGFVGVTGENGSDISYQIPKTLDGQAVVIVSLITLDPQSSFDLTGKTRDDLRNISSQGKVVFGYTCDNASASPKAITLTSAAGGTVDRFAMIDLAFLPQVFANPTHFVLPSFYFTAMDFSAYAGIPEGRTIRLYTVTPEGLYIAMNGLGPFVTDGSIGGTSRLGESDVIYYVPSALQNQARIIVSLIILDDQYADFDLNGKTLQDLAQVTAPGKMIIGFIFDRSTYQPKPVLLRQEGATLGDFLLVDVAVYRTQAMSGEARVLKGRRIRNMTF